MIWYPKFSKYLSCVLIIIAATAAVEGKMSKTLKKMLKKVASSDMHEELAVSDAKLGGIIKVVF